MCGPGMITQGGKLGMRSSLMRLVVTNGDHSEPFCFIQLCSLPNSSEQSCSYSFTANQGRLSDLEGLMPTV